MAKRKKRRAKGVVFNMKEWNYLIKCYHLTPREFEVARLVCQGYDNKEIARALNIAYNTARAHLGNIYKRVGVKSKAGLILQFLQVWSNLSK